MEIKFIYLIHSVLLNSMQKYQKVLMTCSCLFAFPNFSLLNTLKRYLITTAVNIKNK